MKITKENLSAAMSQVIGAIDRNPSSPIMGGVKINASGGKARFYACNMSAAWSCDVDADGDIDAVIPAKKLHDVAKAAKSETADISIEGAQAIIKMGRSRIKASAFDSTDYPAWSEDNNGIVVDCINSKVLLSLIDSVSGAAAKDDVRYYLNGVYLILGDGSLTAVATNGHQLAVNHIAIDSDGETNAIIPSECVTEISKALAKYDGGVSLSIADRDIRLSLGNSEYIGKLLDGKYPNWQAVVPSGKLPHQAKIDSASLAASVKMAIAAGFTAVTLSFTGGKVEIKSENQTDEIIDEIDIDYDGEGVEIAFNAGYMLNMINSLGCDEVILNIADDKKSAALCECDDNNVKFVLMPVRL